jgi:hypothetical protein
MSLTPPNVPAQKEPKRSSAPAVVSRRIEITVEKEWTEVTFRGAAIPPKGTAGATPATEIATPKDSADENVEIVSKK